MKYFITLVLSLSFVAACTTTEKEASKSGNDKNQNLWQGAMKDMAGSLEELLPYMYSEKAFYNPKNDKKIKRSLVDFERAAKKLTPEQIKMKLGKDPLGYYAVSGMKQTLGEIKNSFSRGNKSYSRSLLKGAINYCYKCHSRNQYGVWNNSKLKYETLKLGPLEKVELALSLRDYEKANKLFNEELSEQKSQLSVYNRKKMVKYLLLYAVRIMNQPALALAPLDNAIKNEPFGINKKLYKSWKEQLVRMSKAKKASSSLYRQAQLLYYKLQNSDDYKVSDDLYVQYLKVSALLHGFLNQENIPVNQRVKAYLQLGEIYEYLNEISLGVLPKHYYEVCIHTRPQSSIALKCLEKYEENVVLGYSGSSGIHIPSFELNRIKELKEKINKSRKRN